MVEFPSVAIRPAFGRVVRILGILQTMQRAKKMASFSGKECIQTEYGYLHSVRWEIPSTESIYLIEAECEDLEKSQTQQMLLTTKNF